MKKYYEVYSFDGLFVGIYDYEWQAEQVAAEYDGFYIERKKNYDDNKRNGYL